MRLHWREMHPRAQDQYVAIHVLGYTYRGRFDGDTQGYLERDGESIITEDLSEYTIDFAAATDVLEWLKGHSSSVCFDWSEDDAMWECSVISGGVRSTGIDHEPARVICIAALKSVGKGI